MHLDENENIYPDLKCDMPAAQNSVEECSLKFETSINFSSVMHSVSSVLQLRKLNLARNCPVSTELSMGPLDKLRELILPGIQLASWPLTFLPNLYELDLSNNRISDFHLSAASLPSLRALNMAGNHLRAVNMRGFVKLEFLDLRKNYLVSSKGLENLPRLSHLFLDSNLLGAQSPLEASTGLLASLPRLQVLALNDNRITGPLAVGHVR
jgi:Leucine-rich repeat (LRR) protein